MLSDWNATLDWIYLSKFDFPLNFVYNSDTALDRSYGYGDLTGYFAISVTLVDAVNYFSIFKAISKGLGGF